jgi:hypothetical protein
VGTGRGRGIYAPNIFANDFQPKTDPSWRHPVRIERNMSEPRDSYRPTCHGAFHVSQSQVGAFFKLRQ